VPKVATKAPDIDLKGISSEDLIAEMQLRGEWPDEPEYIEPKEEQDLEPQLMAIYEEFRKRDDAPQCLRDFIYEQIGRILP
jgi:hypothetical protein